MKREDARKFITETQEQLRKQAIRLRKDGMTYKEIAVIVGVHKDTVWRWWQKYKASGAKGLKIQKRGRRYGSQRSLENAQVETIQELIRDRTPDQLKLTFALWTRQAVQELIRLQFGIRMPIRTVGEYLRRWGFSPQKPLKRVYEQQPKAVQKWLKKEYIEIAQRAKQEGAEIHWGDETGIRSDSQYGRSYAPKGKTPVIRLSAKRTSINMISTVTNRGKVRFMIYKEKMNTEVLIKFIKQLIKGSDRKIFLILDNLRVHHAKRVKAWLEKHPKEIEVFYLPSYSPELNPDEYLNGDLKAGVHSRPPSRSQADLIKKLRSHMIKLQKLPQRVSNYFKHPKISYAA
ncbi:IS630 family transposase [Nitrospira defluvii]|nr:IS630 family transposase [Nitrospira defluvii]